MIRNTGRGTFYVGDALECLCGIPEGSVDLVITSPPYNLGEGMGDKGGLRIGHNKSAWAKGLLGAGYSGYADAMPYTAYCSWQREVLLSLWAKLNERGAIFYNHKPRIVKRTLRLPFFVDLPLRQIIIWDRGSGFNHMAGAFKPTHEYIMVYAKPGFCLKSKGHSTIGDVWRIPPERSDHPAPFPLEIPRRILAACDGATVLDPFAGSGTTAIAAQEADRRWVCIEQDYGYASKAIARIEAHAALLDGW